MPAAWCRYATVTTCRRSAATGTCRVWSAASAVGRSIARAPATSTTLAATRQGAAPGRRGRRLLPTIAVSAPATCTTLAATRQGAAPGRRGRRLLPTYTTLASTAVTTTSRQYPPSFVLYSAPGGGEGVNAVRRSQLLHRPIGHYRRSGHRKSLTSAKLGKELKNAERKR